MTRLLAAALLSSFFSAYCQSPAPAPAPAARQRDEELSRSVDDLLWHLKLQDVAEVDKFRYTSLPPAKEKNPTGQGAGNPMIIPAASFIPKNLDRTKKHPLIIFVHGGVQSNFAVSYAHIVRELIEQGYVVLAPEYRGSLGYGAELRDNIDYGGRENDDVYAGLVWALESWNFIDARRVGIIGWSHGGMITLMNIFQHPEAFRVAYAGVPVSDLVARMGYKSDSYRAIFSAPNHIGKTADQNVNEYLRRSPVTWASKLLTPLLIHTNTNDEDVNVLEVQRLITALKVEGKQFEFKVYQNAPGGHQFNRLDTRLARESRNEIYKFLASHLK
jgi:dipeptidyl aminopeptidase/acylaminoacyl peptidase